MDKKEANDLASYIIDSEAFILKQRVAKNRTVKWIHKAIMKLGQDVLETNVNDLIKQLYLD